MQVQQEYNVAQVMMIPYQKTSQKFRSRGKNVPKKNYIDVCLVNIGSGTPFISVLGLRPLENDTYPTEPGVSLLLFSQLDVGSMAKEPFSR